MAINEVGNANNNVVDSISKVKNEKLLDSNGKEYKFNKVLSKEEREKMRLEEEALKGKNRNRGFDKSTFLKLFVAQMQHQDPLEPMSNEQYMTQMSQMTSVEQISNMAASFEKFSKTFDEKGVFVTNMEKFFKEFTDTNKALLARIESLENEIKKLQQ